MAGILGGDYQFDPGTYGYGSGLLGLLGMGQQLPGQVPGGFAPADNSVLPQASAPTGGMMPPQMAPQMAPQAMPQQPAQQAPGLGLGDRAMAALANFSNARGLLPALTGAVTGGLTGQRTDPVGLMLQQQGAIYQALRSANVPDPVARAAALDPEIRKTIAPNLYTKPEFHTLTGLTGEQIPIFTNANNQTVTYPTTSGGAGGAPVTGQQVFDRIEQARDAGANPQQLLQLVPNSLRSGVAAMLGGQALPSNLSNRGAARDNTVKLAHAIDPNFDETLIPARVALQKDYQGGGKAFEEVNALNTVSGHLDKLKNSADALGNSNFKPFNRLSNLYSDTISGSPNLVRFRNDLVTTQNELAKAYHGGHVSDAAYSAFNNSIGEAQTPAELKAAIGELASLLGSKITARERAYQAGMNGLPLPSQYRALNDEAKHSFADIDQWANGTATPSTSSQAAPSIAPIPPPDKDGWINLPNGIRIREKK